ncbi:DUF885 domain-containing protein [Shewanella yunxiaonensis]|uniref:DUF885 domain-containing protein n=1 Tax=Shewanella yunxiaonensis TaxID=2829809 RepID=A0ABX7YPN2_9GAMM|nr:DUF885 domain-containing protein [Shewanella yunxiaonensis]QUN04667.1 DUF885 domain-containing protein [Shewanella yunxiaonensis]
MNKGLVLSTVIAVALGLTACNQKAETANTAKTDVAAEPNVHVVEQQYLKVVDDYFKDYLKLEPLYATFFGVNDYNADFGGDLTDTYLQASHQLNSDYLAKVQLIDRKQLSPQLQLSYDMFVYDRKIALQGEAFPGRLMPISQFYSTVITMVQLGSGESAQPFKTVTDYENWHSRVKGFVTWMALAQQRMNEGMFAKVVLPKVLVERIIPQLDAQLVNAPEDSIFFAPIKQFPDTFSDADRTKITAEYRSMIADELLPAFKSLRDYFNNTYLPAARNSSGFWNLPNGKAWYQYLANYHTTTTMPVEQIHQIGLQEVARIRQEMDKVRQQVGFQGDLKAFFASLSSEPQYFFNTPDELINGYAAVKQRINAVLPKYFHVMPKADYVIKPVEAFRQQSAAGASYEAPAVDGSRPGIFYINTYNLKAQPKWGMTTLSLHEASPGHHFQISIKQELTGVPEFQRFGSYTAFEEGWALYSEYLGIEMGVFSDPYQYFGKLSDEMLRAMRLVVDTGMHAKGWTREQAIQYMKDNSPMAESDIIAEVERYMAIPGQALSYKVGQLKILELRHKAEVALGDKFDLKAFHDQMLTSGSLPLAVMEDKINHWIATQQKA